MLFYDFLYECFDTLMHVFVEANGKTKIETLGYNYVRVSCVYHGQRAEAGYIRSVMWQTLFPDN